MFRKFLPKFLFEIDPLERLEWERRKGLILRNIFNRATSQKLLRVERKSQSLEEKPEDILKSLNEV